MFSLSVAVGLSGFTDRLLRFTAIFAQSYKIISEKANVMKFFFFSTPICAVKMAKAETDFFMRWCFAFVMRGYIG